MTPAKDLLAAVVIAANLDHGYGTKAQVARLLGATPSNLGRAFRVGAQFTDKQVCLWVRRFNSRCDERVDAGFGGGRIKAELADGGWTFTVDGAG